MAATSAIKDAADETTACETQQVHACGWWRQAEGVGHLRGRGVGHRPKVSKDRDLS